MRGGLDIGLWYFKKGVLISPALAAAYKREQQKAIYPVIAVSNQLYQRLRDTPGRRYYHETFDPFPDLFVTFKHPKTKTRVRFLNYLRTAVKEVGWQFDKATYDSYMAAPPHSEERERIMEEGYVRSEAALLRQHKKMIERALKKATNVRVRAKYVFLANYHNKEAQRVLRGRTDLLIPIQQKNS